LHTQPLPGWPIMSRNIKTIARARSIHEESIELHGVVTNAFVWSGSAKNLLRELPELPGDGKLFDVSGKDPYKNVERKRAGEWLLWHAALPGPTAQHFWSR